MKGSGPDMCDCIPWFRPGTLSAFEPIDALHPVLAATIGSANALTLLHGPIDVGATVATLSEPPCRALARLALERPRVFALCERLVRASLGSTLLRMEQRTRAEVVEFLGWTEPEASERERASALFVLVERQQTAKTEARSPVREGHPELDARSVGNPPRTPIVIENNCHVHNSCYIRAHALS
jgi:hypothetical protein